MERNEGIDRGPLGTLTEEALKLVSGRKDNTGNEDPVLGQAMPRETNPERGNEDKTLGQEDIDESAG